MNDYFVIALFFLTLVFMFEMYVQVRQHGLYKIKTVPTDTKASPEQFAKAQSYNLDKSTLRIVRLAYEYVITVIFLFKIGAFFAFCERAALRVFPPSSAFHSHSLASSVAFYAFFTLFSDASDLPLRLWSTFGVERRHGFNKTTWRTFATDWAKVILLKLFFGAAVVAVFILIVARAGAAFPLLLWAFFFALKLVLQTVYPNWIQPCFNQVDYLPEGKLKDQIEALAEKLEFPLTKIYTIDGSKRSAHSNAYFYGLCKEKRIVLFDTLLQQCSDEQIVAVLGHEIGHWALNHLPKTFFVLETFSFLTFYLMRFFLFSPELYTSFGFEGTPFFVGAFLFFIIYGPVHVVFVILGNSITRRFEFQADAYSKKQGKGAHLKTALLTLEKENLSGLIIDPLFSLCHHSHPSVKERIARLD